MTLTRAVLQILLGFNNLKVKFSFNMLTWDQEVSEGVVQEF